MSAAIEGVDITSGEIVAPADLRLAHEPMNAEQANEGTQRVNTYAKRLPQVVKEVFDGRAWEALGYPTWDEYVDDALVITRRYANMLLAAAVNLELLSEMFDVDVALFAIPERVLRGMDAGTMVPEIEAALAGLTGDASDEERVQVIETTVRTETKKTTEASAAERMAAAEERGRQKALADVAARKEREEAEAAAAQAERDRQDAERAARKAAAAKSPEPASTPDGTHGKAGDDDAAATEGSEGAGPATGPLAESSGADGASTVAPDGAGGTGPAEGPAPSTTTIEAAERAAVSTDMVAARRLLDRDPAAVVALMSAEDAETWCAHVDDMADFAHRWDEAVKDRNKLRSVQ